MKMRTLVILLLVLGVLAALLILHRGWSPDTTKVQGSRLFDQFPVNAVASLTVISANNTASLVKKEGGWVVEERFSYPADFGKIANLVRTLKEVKVGRQFAGSDETLQRLALKDPEDPVATDNEKGIRLLLKDDKQNILISILLDQQQSANNSGQKVPGRYVRLGNDFTVYLVDKRFITVREAPTTWLDSILLKVPRSDIKRISCTSTRDNKELYSFARSGKEEDLQVVSGILTSKPINPLMVNKLADGLAYLNILDVVQPIATPFTAAEFPFRFDYENFNGTIYRIYLGKSNPIPEPCELRLAVDYRRPPSGKELPPPTGNDKKQAEQQSPSQKTPEEIVLEANKLNERLGPWLYLVSSSQYRTFITDLDRFVMKQAKRSPPDRKLPAPAE